MELEVVRVGPRQSPSFDPESSDYLGNMMILGQLVGTLVVEKHGNSGESAPYLARRWDVTADGRVWTFDLHEKVVCEDGAEIDAPGMIGSLQRIFRQNIKEGRLPVFDGLVGWEAFATGKGTLAGLSAPERHKLRMEFVGRPSGLLEYLGMPVYGYWCDAGFADGRWRDKHKIVSSGGYRVASVRDDGHVELARRDGWKLLPPDAPARIRFRVEPDGKEFVGPKSRADIILYRGWAGETFDESRFVRMNGTPTMLNFVSLAASEGLFFSSAGARRVFAARLRAAQGRGEHRSTSPVSIVGRDFYPSHPAAPNLGEEERLAKATFPNRPSSPLRVNIRPSVTGPDRDYIRGLVVSVLTDLSVPFEFVDSRFLSDRSMRVEDFDIKIGGVDAGSGFENWLTKMMFCSPLGVRLPDPSGRICELTDGVEKGRLALSSKEYADRFNAILEEDAALLPISRYGMTWFFSRELDLERITPALVVPRFELLRKRASG
jgi:hypothetical protein